MKLTPERMAAFLAALVASGGNVTRACEAVSICRMTAYVWRDADPEFAAAWEKAKDAGIDALEDEARRRAFEGFEKPVFHQGAQCGAIREYSDTLTIFLLKGARPEKYRDRVSSEITGANGGPIETKSTVTMTPEEAYKRMLG